MASKTTFSCGKALDITQAAALHGRLLKALNKSSHIELKADQVEKADTAGLQLLAALHREASSTGGAIVWKQPSDTVCETAELLGLTAILQLHN